MLRATEARDASAISSLGKLLARLEPSGEQRVRPSPLYPHLVNRTTLSPLAHRPVGPCSLGPQPSRPAPAISFFFLLSIRSNYDVHVHYDYRPWHFLSLSIPFFLFISFVENLEATPISHNFWNYLYVARRIVGKN